MPIYPIIAAVKTEETFEYALKSKVESIALLKGDICSIGPVIKAGQAAGKKMLLHFDLIEGFGRDEHAIRYIKQVFDPNAIITTKTSLIKTCKQIGLRSILRVFIFDNLSLKSAINNINSTLPDCVEMLPGILPSVLKTLLQESKCKTFFVGGLVETVEHVSQALKNGAAAASTSCLELWNKF